jgi:hypothetical protein
MTRDEVLEQAELQLDSASAAAGVINNAAERAEARVRIAKAYLDLARELDKTN